MIKERLLSAAAAARTRAYAPYSKFLVGAALLTEKGAVITGANTENASYGLTVCAERVAIFNALHAGHRQFKALAVFTETSPPSSPCGACRQVLWEFAGDIPVFMGNAQGEVTESTLKSLLPSPFGTAQWAENPVSEALEEKEALWRLSVTFSPIGHVLNTYQMAKDIPGNYKERTSKIILDPAFEEGLYRLDEEEKIIVIAYLNKSEGFRLKGERRGRGGEVYGVFASRTPGRPNAIAQSVVDLLAIEKNVLTVRGLDLINGTPVLDLKTDYRRES